MVSRDAVLTRPFLRTPIPQTIARSLLNVQSAGKSPHRSRKYLQDVVTAGTAGSSAPRHFTGTQSSKTAYGGHRKNHGDYLEPAVRPQAVCEVTGGCGREACRPHAM